GRDGPPQRPAHERRDVHRHRRRRLTGQRHGARGRHGQRHRPGRRPVEARGREQRRHLLHRRPDSDPPPPDPPPARRPPRAHCRTSVNPAFAELDLPVNFNLDLAPLLQLTSNSSLRLTADGSLNFTVGVYLGDAPSSSKLDTSMPLTEVNGGVPVSTDKVITGTSDVRTGQGPLTADAGFTLTVNGGAPRAVNVARTGTVTGLTITD